MSITTGQNVAAGDFINDGEKNGTPANDNGRVPKLEQVNSQDAKVAGTWHAAPTIRQYTSGATWNKPSKLAYILVEVVGGGGGGGGESTNNGAGGGGGAGGYSRKVIKAGDLSTTESVTVGSGGAGGAGDGSAGGTSSFGSHCSATGGNGGKDNNTSNGLGGTGGTGSNGDVNATGGQGQSGYSDSGSDSSVWGLPVGAASVLGAYGKGGNGAISGGTGAAGNAGVVVLTEYF